MSQTKKRFYITGGTLPRDASSYIERSADVELLSELQAGHFCYVLTSRQMGKSSLMVRTFVRLKEEGVQCAVIDLTAFGQNLDAEQWYSAILNRLGEQLDLEDELDDFWVSHAAVNPLFRLIRALREVVLVHETREIVLFIDEIDVVRSLPFSVDEFFAAIRSCYNRRTEDSAFDRLTFCLLGVASPSDLIVDTKMTPFNIGTRIDLTDFTLKEALPLNFGLPSQSSSAILERVLWWTGGQPFLTQRLCQAVAIDKSVSRPSNVDRVCSNLFLTHTAHESDDNLAFVRNRLLNSEVDVTSLLDIYKGILSRKLVADEEANPICAVLKLSGIVKVERGFLKVRNRIYQRVFDAAWARDRMPDAEVRRQRVAYRKGVFRTLAVGAILMVLFATLAVSATINSSRARASESLALREQHKAEASAKEARISAIAERQQTRVANQERLRANAKATEANILKKKADQNLILAEERLTSLWSANNAKDGALRMAQTERVSAERNLYYAKINLAQIEFHAENIVHTKQLLRETASSKYRGIEWDYWNRRCNSDLITIHGEMWEMLEHGSFFAPAKVNPAGLFKESQITKAPWDLVTRIHIRKYMGILDQLGFGILSPDGTKVASLNDNKAVIWDLKKKKVILTLKHDGYVECATFSPDGQTLVVCLRNGTVHVWDIISGIEKASVRGHTGWILSVAISPNGKVFLTGGEDSIVKGWDTQSGRELFTISGNTGGIQGLAFSPDGNNIYFFQAANRGKPNIRALDYKSKLEEFNRPLGEGCNIFRLFPDGKQFAIGFNDGRIEVMDITTGKLMFVLHGHSQQVNALDIFANGERIISRTDESIKVWDTRLAYDNLSPFIELLLLGVPTKMGKSSQIVKTRMSYTGKTIPILRESFSPDGKRIASMYSDKTARVWDSTTTDEILSLRGHTDRVFVAEYSPDGRIIATGSKDTTVKLWDSKTGREIRTLKGHTREVEEVAFSPDSKLVATASSDCSGKVWDVATGKELVTLKGHVSYIGSIAFSPDGRHIVTGCRDFTASIWDVATGKELFVLQNASSVGSVAYSQDGKRIVTVSGSGSHTEVKLWDPSTGTELLRISGDMGNTNEVLLSRDGKRVFTRGSDSYRTVWHAKI